MFVGIDPGKQGAFVQLGDGGHFKWFTMPLTDIGEVDFDSVMKLLKTTNKYETVVCIERAKPMAMGSKHAFNYGRDFAKIEIALKLSELPTTYVEPTTWSKMMTEGVSKDLIPKLRSCVAVERLFPVESKSIPRNKNGKMHDGIMEALLIAGYARSRVMAGTTIKDRSGVKIGDQI